MSGNTYAPTKRAACFSPVIGLTRLGTWIPMPNPLSRIQLLWQRFCPPPAPAYAMAPIISAKPSSAGNCPKLVTAWGSSAQVSPLTTSARATMKKPPIRITLTVISRSSAT